MRITMLLVGDIGGTKTILALFTAEAGPRNPVVQRSFPSTEYASLEAVISEFIAGLDAEIDCACFGVAGPVVEGRARITNLPWLIDRENLKSVFDLKKATLLNDLESFAYSIPILEQEDIHTLSAGSPIAGGNIAVLAPGTGFGEAFITFDGDGYRVHASEGGHSSFSPMNKLQVGLLEYLWEDRGYEHVSFERVCSGGLGIPNIYSYLKNKCLAEEPPWLTEKLSAVDDPTPIIFKAALDILNPCDICLQTLNMFIAILGAEAGNLAVKVLSTGGIYLGGGIPPRIIPSLQQPLFLNSLRNKGRFKELLTKMPVHVIANARAGLMGAAAYGLHKML